MTGSSTQEGGKLRSSKKGAGREEGAVAGAEGAGSQLRITELDDESQSLLLHALVFVSGVLDEITGGTSKIRGFLLYI
jgi:hypothetical protein